MNSFRILLLTVFATLLAATVSAQPKITVIGGEIVNWGRVAPGYLKRDVRVTNTGTDTLRISSVNPSCGCTTAPIDRHALQHGDTATISVSLNALNPGEVSKLLSIASNDPQNPMLTLTLEAKVVMDIMAMPTVFPVRQNTTVGEEYTTTVEIRNETDSAIQIGRPRVLDNGEMEIRLEMMTPYRLAPRERLKLTAHVIPLKEGTLSTEVALPTSSANPAELRIPIYCTAKKATSAMDTQATK